MKVIGIETSCDETGVAIFDTQKGIVAETLYSQVAVHAEYGGVVPELASRDHIRKLVPLMREVFAKAGLSYGEIDGVAIMTDTDNTKRKAISYYKNIYFSN